MQYQQRRVQACALKERILDEVNAAALGIGESGEKATATCHSDGHLVGVGGVGGHGEDGGGALLRVDAERTMGRENPTVVVDVIQLVGVGAIGACDESPVTFLGKGIAARGGGGTDVSVGVAVDRLLRVRIPRVAKREGIRKGHHLQGAEDGGQDEKLHEEHG